ncbi:DUF4355 domain-containing protein [Limosilactobacillus mucosae]|uniref:DUF4355 domain-containing protein n=1 Tax=Limosilactobacillus mucosae TaxID=97478 RepID=UPI000696278F|nr:DUF4355 domain-containing protein [Limosilactobacillus mucosae]
MYKKLVQSGLVKTHSLPMMLQFFAEQGSEGSEGAPNTESEQPNESEEKQGEQQAKTFTQDEVNKIVSQRLERQKEQLKAKEDEAKKLSRMNAEQKANYELEKANKRAEEAAAKLARYEMRDSAKQMLADGGFNNADNSLLDLVVTDTAESTQANVNVLLNAIEAIREDERNKLGSPPHAWGNTPLKLWMNWNKEDHPHIHGEYFSSSLNKIYYTLFYMKAISFLSNLLKKNQSSSSQLDSS